ncbi:UNVERIFIED_CONTAM: hypothetical protein Scaly_0882500 [Sesamum calycinum]|uniref:Pectinesterase inhibitor domain-containing protein n=1 Tax=Sesamum calycinum TaxID=2727403 RepID=A0AAW2QWI7_9LAMI
MNDLFFFCFAALLLPLHQSNAAADDLVHQWCRRTSDNDVCTSVIEADPRDNLKHSPNGFCAILRDRGLADAAATKAKISDALKNTTQLYAVQCLQDCSDFYNRTIYIFNYVDFSVLNHRNYPGLNIDIAGAYDAVRDCEDGFKERPGTLPSPITQENLRMMKIIDTILSIINLKECNKADYCG